MDSRTGPEYSKICDLVLADEKFQILKFFNQEYIMEMKEGMQKFIIFSLK